MSTPTIAPAAQKDALLERLMAPRKAPCISLVLPTHRTWPDAEQDQLILRRLVEQALARITERGNKREMAPWTERLQALAEEVDHRKNLEGMAIFIDGDSTEIVRLPFTVEERCMVDDTFATREVVRWRLGAVEHYVLVYSTGSSRLYRAYNDQLLEEVEDGFPVQNAYSGTTPLSATGGRAQNAATSGYLRELDTKVRKAVGEYGRVVVACTQEQYPPMVAGASRPSIYIGNLPGNHEHLTPGEVVRQAWSVAYEEQKNRHLADLERINSAPSDKLATSIKDIWALVHHGRGELLLVERDLRVAARVHEGRIEIVDDPTIPGVADDIVDDIIEEQLRMGGEVHILPNDSLTEHAGIALLLRY